MILAWSGASLTLMKAAPARSMDRTKKPYHHSVPLRSLSLCGCLRPSHITGIVARTGTKMKARCRNRKPVNIGSTMYKSTKKYIPRRYFFEFWIALGTCSLSSFLDASSMASSCVFSPLPESSFPMATKARGLRAAPVAPAAPDHSTVLPGNRGVATRCRMNVKDPEAKERVGVRARQGVDCLTQ